MAFNAIAWVIDDKIATKWYTIYNIICNIWNNYGI